MKKIDFVMNRVLHLLEVRRINTKEKVIFLTFDDGPEPGITEFVLDLLSKHNAKATFFCRGDNAEKNPMLLSRIITEGHKLGNHTYSHINSFNTPTHEYISDIIRADVFLKTHLFRPPWGSITVSAFVKLVRKYKIVYWSLMSGDTKLEQFDKKNDFSRLIQKTKIGDVVLFHCCKRHENETRQLLPDYLDWLENQGYCMLPLN